MWRGDTSERSDRFSSSSSLSFLWSVSLTNPPEASTLVFLPLWTQTGGGGQEALTSDPRCIISVSLNIFACSADLHLAVVHTESTSTFYRLIGINKARMLTLGSCWTHPRSPQLHWCKTVAARPSGSAHDAAVPPARGQIIHSLWVPYTHL